MFFHPVKETCRGLDGQKRESFPFTRVVLWNLNNRNPF